MKTLYLDCFSGISGDMMVGALIDLGLPSSLLDSELKKLPLEGYSINISRIKRSGIDAANFTVEVKKQHKQRDYKSIKEMISSSALNNNVKTISLRIFEILAIAEGKIHGIDPEDVHFHEVGGVDSIVDIVGAAIGIDFFKIDKTFSSKIVTGVGSVVSDHGIMPLPAPATAEILKGVPLSQSKIAGEMVTPTGAAILKALSKHYGTMPEMVVEKIGYGAGDKDFGSHPNLLRIFLGEVKDETVLVPFEEDTVLIMEAAIDDMNPQFYEPLIDKLFFAGALDVTMSSLYMKKNRPGTLLSVLIPPELKIKISKIIFSESTTIGIRCIKSERIKLKRSKKTVQTPLGEVRVKVIDMGKGVEDFRPEYDDIKKLSLQNSLSIRDTLSKIKVFLAETTNEEN